MRGSRVLCDRLTCRCFRRDRWATVDFGIFVANGSEAQRIHCAHRSRTHCENVTHDSTHTSGRALKRLDGAWMVMRLDLECDGDTVTDVDDSRVLFACADEDLR